MMRSGNPAGAVRVSTEPSVDALSTITTVESVTVSHTVAEIDRRQSTNWAPAFQFTIAIPTERGGWPSIRSHCTCLRSNAGGPNGAAVAPAGA